ncbi:MAG: DNA-processing protein DprA [Patescibacteria group bacterium]
MLEKEKIFANAFNQSLQIGTAGLGKIRKYFDGFKNAWTASFSEIKKASELKKLEEFRNKINPEKEFEILEKENIKVLLKQELPPLLKEIYLPPEILYIKGELPCEDKIHLTVVGPRKFSSYGKEACEKIIGELKEHDFVIVSGLAQGIDSIAHNSALNNQMQTIAVLGNGLHDSAIYPYRNIGLAHNIVKNSGCIISEYPLMMKAAQFTFPQRNRIAAGLSQGTLVIEAAEKSGSLITAFLALESNREVFAIPGNIFSMNSKGANNLLKMGGLPVTKADDILRAFGIEEKVDEKQIEINLSPNENKIISLLVDPMERDELIRKIKMPPQEVNPLLMQMEIRGIIKEIENKIFKI